MWEGVLDLVEGVDTGVEASLRLLVKDSVKSLIRVSSSSTLEGSVRAGRLDSSECLNLIQFVDIFGGGGDLVEL